MYSRNWPAWVHPFASAVDTPLPVPPERAEIMLDYRAPWCEVPVVSRDAHFARYPDKGIDEWQRVRGLLDET